IYSLAYWMTGHPGISQELVRKTYLYAAPDTDENALLKTFRSCYIDQFCQDINLPLTEQQDQKNILLLDSMKRCTADIKFSVLLSEISSLSQLQISEILDKPLDTIRLWLFWGRKLFVNNYLLKATG
ncbi:MAG: RNA polymerase subunit sigma-24, partial [Chlorobium sp.]